MPTFHDLSKPRLAELQNSFTLHMWLQVLARPQIYAGLKRKPTRDHLLTLIDYYLPFARSRRESWQEQGYSSGRPDEERHEQLTYQFREMCRRWMPPELPVELVDAARGLLIAEGSASTAWTWDEDLGEELSSLEAGLIWPEDVAEKMKGERPSP